MTMPPKVKPEQEVNAYLFYTQRLLTSLNSASISNSQVDHMALGAAICLTLRQAWQSWLKELNRYLGLELNEGLLLEQGSCTHPEWLYLQELYRQEQSWLNELYLLFEPRVNITPEVNSFAEDAMRIHAVQVDTPEKSLNETLAFVLSEFKNYIQIVRQRQIEW